MDRKRLRARHFDKILTYETAYNKPYRYVVDDYISGQFTPEQYRAYNAVDPDDKGAIAKYIDDLFYGFSHPLSSYNLMQEKRLQSNLRDEEMELERVNRNIEDLHGIEDYLSDIDDQEQRTNDITKLGSEIRKMQLSGDTTSTSYQDAVKRYQKAYEDYHAADKRILDRTEFYKTEGKNSESVRWLLFDPDKDSMGADEVLKNIFASKQGWYLGNGFINDADRISQNIIDLPGNIFDAAASAFGKMLPSVQQMRDYYGEKNSLAELFAGYNSGEFTRRYIGKTDPYDHSTDRWFVDARTDSGVRKQIREKLAEEEKYYSRLKLLRLQEVADADRVLRNGSWYFNPQGIDPKFREIQESRQYGVFSFLNPANLPYTFSELGSSMSTWQSMLGSMAIDAGVQRAVKAIGSKVVGGPLTALSVAKTAQEFAAALKKLQRAKDIVEDIDKIGKAVALSGSIYLTRQMRRNETNNEAMDAWMSRVMSDAMSQGIDTYSVEQQIRKALPQYGINPEGLDSNEVIERGLAYNIKTDNQDFENLRQSSRAGLTQLINRNNALAFVDYIETLPFLSYQGSLFKSAVQKLRGKVVPKYDKSGKITNFDALIAQETPEVQAVLKSTFPSVTAFLDKKIESAALKIFKNPVRRKMFADSAKFLNKKASKLFPLMTKEGIEEGQQHIIQRDYQNGFYDNYSRPESMFDLPSFFDDAVLGTDAVASYIGGMFGEPDADTKELMQAMAIGAITAMWFRAPHTIATNMLSLKQKRRLNEVGIDFVNPDSENFRGLLSQLKDDKILGRMISESAQSVQDDNHTEIFFNALKRGRTFQLLNNTLEEYKMYKGPGVEDSFIEDDLKLLNATYATYNSPVTEENLKALDIEKNSNAHLFYVQDAVNKIVRSARGAEVYQNSQSLYQAKVDEMLQKINNITDKVLGISTEEITPEEQDDAEFIRSLVEDKNAAIDAEALRRANPPKDEIRKRALKNLGLREEDLKTKGRSKLKDRRRVQKNKKDLDTEIQRIIDEEYSVEEFNDPSETLKNYVTQKYKSMLDYLHLMTYDFLKKFLTDRSKALNFIRKEFGIPVQADVLDGVVHYLDEVYKKAHLEQTKTELSLQKELDNIFGTYGIEANEEEYKKLLDSLYDTQRLPQDLRTLIINKVLNQAVSTILLNSAQAYVTGQANPNYLRLFQRQLSWSQLSPQQRLVIVDEENKNTSLVLDEDLVKQTYQRRRREYYKKLNEIRDKYNKIQDNEDDEKSIREKIDLEELAALLYINKSLLNKIDRSVSAHYDRTKNTENLSLEMENTVYDGKSLPYLNLKSRILSKSDETDTSGKQDERIDESNKLDENSTQTSSDESEITPDTKSQETQESATKIQEQTEENKNQEEVKPSNKSIEQISELERRLREEYGLQDPDENAGNNNDESLEETKSSVEVQTGPKLQEGEESTNKNEEDEENTNFNQEEIPDSFGSNINEDIDEEETKSIEDRLENKDDENLNEDFSSGSNIRFRNRKIEQVSSSQEAEIDYLSKTLFYQPFKTENGIRVPNEDVPVLKVGDIPVRLLNDAVLKSPAELSRRLVKDGWFAKTKKYFIITADQGHVDMTNPDSLNVVMIIQDGKDAFAVFMRGLSKHWTNSEDINRTKPNRDRRQELLSKLREMFVSDEYRLPYDLNSEEYKSVMQHRMSVYYDELNKLYEDETGDVYVGSTPQDWSNRIKHLNKWSNDRLDIIDMALNRQRKKMSIEGKPVMTEERIRLLISALMEARLAIINSCVSKDENGEYVVLTEGYKIVEPSDGDVVISNGAYNDQKDQYERPIYRNCDQAGMGMSDDIELLTQLIFKDEVKIGYGVGERVDDEQLVGAILNIDPTKVGNSDWDVHVATGKSGKIYVILKGPSGREAAVQLHEQAFFGNNINIQPSDIDEAFDENGRIIKGKTPSIAEFILRGLTNTIHADAFGYNVDRNIISELISIIVHADEKTRVSRRTERSKPWLGRKLLWYDGNKKILHIALPTNQSSSAPTRFQIPFDNLFGPNSSKELRAKVIATIARNFHWNTEKDDLANDMVALYPALFDYLRDVFQDSDSYSILGIPELTFNKDDFFDKNLRKKSVSLIAWLLHTGRINTDKGDTVFRDPFVFCNGINKTNVREDAQYNAIVSARNKQIKALKRLAQKAATPLKKEEKPEKPHETETPSQKRTPQSILKEREERNEQVRKIIDSRIPFEKRIQKITEIYKKYDASATLDYEDFSIRGRVIAFFKGKISKSIAYNSYKKDGVEIKGLKAFGLANPSKRAKEYFKEGGIGTEKLAEEIISFINQNVHQFEDEREVDPVEVIDEIVNVFSELEKFPIEFLEFLSKVDKTEENLLQSENEEIDFLEENGTSSVDLTPTIQDQIDEILLRYETQYGKDVADKIKSQLGTAKDVISQKGYKNVFLINIKFSDKDKSDSQLLEELSEQLLKIKSINLDYQSRSIRRLVDGDDVLVFLEKEDGSKQIVQMPVSRIDNIISSTGGINGVYSTKRGIFNTLNVEESRSFLQDLLGLKPSQVIITDALLKTASDDIVFGVTMLASSVIDPNENTPTIIMSSQGRRGMQYHEGFHYVNLLLHDAKQRKELYDEFRRRNPWCSKYSDEKVEEVLAERFRKYANRTTSNTISSKIKRYFSNVMDFIFQSRKRTLLRSVYNNILSGKYVGMQLDKKSLEEFKRAHASGAYMDVGIPAQRKEVMDKFNHIKDYKTYYKIAESLAKSYVAFVLSNTVEQTLQNSKNSFQRFLGVLEEQTIFDSNTKYILDILNNPEGFADVVQDVLKKYGFIGRIVKLSDDLQTEYDQVFDVDQFEVSAKANVAFRAKLFLSCVKEGELKDGRFVPTIDEYTHLEKYYDFDQAYSNAIAELSRYGSYTEMYNRVHELSTKVAFFASLLQLLDKISGDVELLSLILAALRKQSPNIMFTSIGKSLKDEAKKGPKVELDNEASSQEDIGRSKLEEVVFNLQRKIKISDDNTLRSTRSTLRSWSLNLFSSGMFRYNSATKSNSISQSYVLSMQDLYTSIKVKLNKIRSEVKTLSQNQALFSTELLQVENDIVRLLNNMGINYDVTTFNVYLMYDMPVSDIGDNLKLLYKLEQFTGITTKANDIKGGSLRFFLKLFLGNLMDFNTGKQPSAYLNKIFKEPLSFMLTYTGWGIKTDIYNMAKIYSLVNPNPKELSVRTPGGKTRYPTNENNTVSDIVRWLHDNKDGYIENMLDTPYAGNSKILKTALDILNDFRGKGNDLLFKLGLFCGMEDSDTKDNGDYFGITPLDDVVNKMLFLHKNMLVFPTMADKKTFYVLRLMSLSNNEELAEKTFSLPHDLLTLNNPSKDGFTVPRRFSNDTLKIFIGYFRDEIKTLELYYSRKNIEELVKNPSKLKKNYHGKVKNGRLLFGGNGGIFRYFYDLYKYSDGKGHIINMNQMLEAVYNMQSSIEDPDSDDSVSWLREKDENGVQLDLDGFELVRKQLKEIKDRYFLNGRPTQLLYDDINTMLFSRISEACGVNFDNGTAFEGELNSGDMALLMPGSILQNRCIPNQILNEYRKQIREKIQYQDEDKIKERQRIQQKAISDIENDITLDEQTKKQRIEELKLIQQKANQINDDYVNEMDVVLSVIGNYVVGQMMSVIELEKVMFGDPAFYKYLYFTEEELKSAAKRRLKFTDKDLESEDNLERLQDEIDKNSKYTLVNPVSNETITVPVKVLSEKYSDKIKRLGGVLSPGSEIRTDYTPEILAKYPELTSNKYTIASLADIDAKSLYYNEAVLRFKKQRLADYIRQNSLDPEIAKLTQTSISVESVEEPVFYFLTKKIVRTTAKANKHTLYIFEDNLERSSKNVGGFITKGWYATKYGKNKQLSYGRQESSRLRGVDNAFPISTRLNANLDQINQLNLQEFKKQIDDEFDTIRFAWSTGNYTNVLFVLNEYNLIDSIQNEEAREYLREKLNLLKYDLGTRPTEKRANRNIKKAINALYYNDLYFESVFNNLEDGIKESIEEEAKKSAAAYDGINVSDAQVLIRPACYRKIRIGLGEWSMKATDIQYVAQDGTTKTVQYSDEIAYNIIENEDDWMSDEEKSAIVRHFEAYPLKMSYFSNQPQKLSESDTLAVPVYNKMAIFPVFKFMYTSKTGKQIYLRMNLKDNEIDMFAFESAIKVGLGLNIYSPFGRSTTQLTTLNDALNKKSSHYISSSDYTVKQNTGFDTIPVEIQVFDGLRMQLNTESHEDVKRNIGTQMFKILFSNILPDEDYKFSDGTVLSGQLIRENIMSYINELTRYGIDEVKRNFYKPDGETVDSLKVAEYVYRVFLNNGVGKTTEEIIAKGGKAASTTPRRLLELSVSAMINRAVVDIPTNGGSAIQQSSFGLISYDKDKILTQAEYDGNFYVPNNGKELKWIDENGAMEVILSLNFFRHVVPKQYQRTDADMRQWLINHDIIAGFKKDIVIRPDVGAFLTENLDKELVEYGIYTIPWKDDPKKKKRVLRIWLRGQKLKGWFELVADTDFLNKKYNGDYSVHFKTNNGKFGNDEVEESTKEERAILFEQLAKVIPYGARISTHGDVSVGGIYGLNKLGNDNNWTRSQSTRKVKSKETGEEINIPIFVKPNRKVSDYQYYTPQDAYKINSLNTSVSEVGFSAIVSQRLKSRGFYTLGDISKVKSKNEFKRRFDKNELSDNEFDLIERLLNEFSIPFGTTEPEAKQVQSKPKPFGVGYRIPTQGISSTFAFTVADVLPRNVGDLIIVPREFTGQTGSDFDVDKIYLATLSFRGGILEEGESLGGTRNKLLQTYIEILTNTKNFSNARASIDTITDKIKKEILPMIKTKSGRYLSAMYELTPSFQELRKKEFSTGKDGIGPFALNITNLALTLFASLTFSYPEDNMTTGFRLGDLDRSVGQDGLLISDWLSAMVNAHVDVAKDPYIFDLNVNKATYNMANFLFRAGKGASTLLFLAQPALKEYARDVTNRGGIYSGRVDAIQRYEYDDQILDRLKRKYIKLVDDEFNRTYQQMPSKSILLSNGAIEIKRLIDSFREGSDVNWYMVFDENLLSDGLSGNNKLKQLVVQEFVIRSFIKLKSYADELGELVKNSKIDTKKFGNDTATHLNFINNLSYFINKQSSTEFTLTREVDGIPARMQDHKTALSHYYMSSYLNDKLFTALLLYDEILSTQLITATDMYKKTFVDVMTNIVGASSVEGCYNTLSNEDKVRAIGEAIDNILRTQTLFEFSNNYSDEYQDADKYQGAIDFTFGGNKDELYKQFFRIMNGDSKSSDPYEKLSLFSNISKLIQDINNNPKSELYYGMSDGNGIMDNALLLFLRPMPASDRNSIPRMQFKRPKISITDTQKAEITSSFEFMLTHKNERIRRIARDIAIYAYYSTYDMGVGGSFFDLVPLDYRRQYDVAMEAGLNAYRSYSTVDTEGITDMICRNFWFDPQIVRVYKPNPKDLKHVEVFGRGLPGLNLSGYIFTDFTSAAYIKVYNKKLNKYFLYRHSYDAAIYNSNGKLSRLIPVYVLTTKYGLHDGDNHVYEFINNSEKSIFPDNNIPKVDTSLLEIDASINIHTKDLKKGGTIRIIRHEFSDVNISKYIHKYIDYNFSNYGLNDSNIEVTEQDPREFSEINIPLDKGRDFVMQLLPEISHLKDGPSDISFTGTPEITPNKAYINQYIKELLYKYESRLDRSLSFAKRESLIKQYNKKLELLASNNSRLRAIREYTHQLFSDLQLNGLVYDNIFVSIDDEVGKEVIKMLLLDAKVEPQRLHILSKEPMTTQQLLEILQDLLNVLGDEELLELDQTNIQIEEVKLLVQEQPEQTETEPLTKEVENSSENDELKPQLKSKEDEGPTSKSEEDSKPETNDMRDLRFADDAGEVDMNEIFEKLKQQQKNKGC